MMISQHYHTRTPSSRRYTTGIFMTVVFRVTAIIAITLGIASASSRNTNNNDNNKKEQWNHRNDNYYKDSMGRHASFYTTYNLVRIRLDDYDSTFTIQDENRSSFPVTISRFCPVDNLLFRPMQVVQVPENYTALLCDPTITNETKFRTMLQYDNYHKNLYGPIAIAVPSSSHDNTYCSMDEMISNIERINEISLGYNNITHLILPKSYQPIKSNSLATTTEATTANSWSTEDPCLYSNIITLFVTDDSIYKIESEITKEYNLATTNSSDQFLLIIAADVNNDGVIIPDDDDTYYGSIPDLRPFVRGDRSLSSSGGINNTLKIWIIVGFGFMILCCCFSRYGIREAQNVDRLRSLPRLAQQEQQRNLDHNDPSLDNSKKKEAALTEAEFATLPRIAYYLITQQGTNAESNNEVTERHVVQEDSNETPINQSVAKQQQQLNSESSKDNYEHDGEDKSSNYDTKERTARQYYSSSNNNLDTEKTNDENSDHILINNRNDGCSICLEEFQHDEIIISLPRCSHLFHTKCIGEWLLERKKHTCPLCKTSIVLPPVIKDDDNINNDNNEEV